MHYLALFVLILMPALAGCAASGLRGMDEKQLKALSGTAVCDHAESIMYGSVSTILASTDDTKKGATSENTTTIKCGRAEMTITNKVGVLVPFGATTTTITTVTPAKPAAP